MCLVYIFKILNLGIGLSLESYEHIKNKVRKFNCYLIFRAPKTFVHGVFKDLAVILTLIYLLGSTYRKNII